MAQALQPKCLIFDLEIVPAHDGTPERIIKLGALRPDTAESLELDTGTVTLDRPTISITGAEARHAVTVSRLGVGESISIGNGAGLVVAGVVVAAAVMADAPAADKVAVFDAMLSPVATGSTRSSSPACAPAIP